METFFQMYFVGLYFFNKLKEKFKDKSVEIMISTINFIIGGPIKNNT